MSNGTAARNHLAEASAIFHPPQCTARSLLQRAAYPHRPMSNSVHIPDGCSRHDGLTHRVALYIAPNSHDLPGHLQPEDIGDSRWWGDCACSRNDQYSGLMRCDTFALEGVSSVQRREGDLDKYLAAQQEELGQSIVIHRSVTVPASWSRHRALSDHEMCVLSDHCNHCGRCCHWTIV